ncbi:MAG: hypothetical protein LBF24_03265 [Puniceicoccales bacterium]|nr:hypothetical protein [Puniceicoccales bacterium]
MNADGISVDSERALATLEGSLSALDAERNAYLAAMTEASKMHDFETVRLLVPQVAETRKLRTELGTVIAAYHSGVRSAAVLACFLPLCAALPEEQKGDGRRMLMTICKNLSDEADAVSKSAIEQQEEATKQAKKATETAELVRDRAEKERDVLVARMRNDRARLRVALRQMAYDSSNPLWRFFGGSIHKITDEDVTNLLSGMSQEDIDAVMAKF